MNPDNQSDQPNPVPQGSSPELNQNLDGQPPMEAQGSQFAAPATSTPVSEPQPTFQNPSMPQQQPAGPEGVPQPFGPQQNTAQPQQPMNPMNPSVPPTSPMMGAAPAQPPSSGSPFSGLNKKLIIWIAAGVGALIVIIIAVLLVVSSFAVSKNDYKAAYDYANDARSSYSKMSGLAYVSSYSTETESKNNLDTFKKSKQDFDQTIKQLGETKAVQRDGKAKELYDALMSKKKSFDGAVDVTIETYEYILPAMAEFNTASSANLSKLATAVSAAASKLEASEGEIKSELNKNFASKMATLFKRYAALLKKVEAYRADYSKYDSKISSEYSSTSSEISTAIRNWSSDIRKLADDSEIKDEFNALGEYLAEKTSS